MSNNHSHNFPIVVARNGRHLVINWGNTPPDIVSNIKIKAKKTTSHTAKMDAILLVYREKII